MNRKLLALAVTAALAAPLTAQAAPTVYGLLNLSVDMVDQESTGDDEWQVNSNSSRLGVKGEEDLGNKYSAVYKAEFGVDADEVSGLTGRDRYLGLKSTWGTVKLGAFDSALKTAQGNVDQFNDMTFTDMGNYFAGENRMANVIGYESPKIADAVTIKVNLQPGEDTAGGNDSPADGISASVAYDAAGLYLALAMDSGVSSGPFNDVTNRDAVRLVATYTMDALQLGAMLQTSENSDDLAAGGQDDEEGVLVSAAFTMGKNVLKGQVAMVNRDFGGGAEADGMFVGVGADHNFTDMTKAYAQISMLSADNAGAAADTDDTVLTVGMQTKF
ncbi:MAG: porin [Moraxellaceae bacterium]|nr:porin [Moraxellaceae bacterium]